MDEPKRILIVEDVPADAELAQREINRDCKSCTYRVVETREEFLDALETFAPDLIVSDYSLPTFDGMTALTLTGERSPATPLIILTGSQNEDVAVDCIKAGAADYVLKDSIRRLGPAVAGALEVKRVRMEKERAEEALRESEERYRAMAENMTDTVWVMDMNLRTTYVSPSVVRSSGYTVDELSAIPLEKYFTPESFAVASRVIAEELTPKRLAQKDLEISRTLEIELVKKDGSIMWAEIVLTLVRDKKGMPKEIIGVGRDITERRKAQEAIRESERRYRELVENIADIVYIADDRGNILFLNGAAVRFFGHSRDDTFGRSFTEFLVPSSLKTAADVFKRQLAGEDVGTFELDFYDGQGNVKTLETREELIWEGGRVVQVHGLGRDVTERRKAEEAISESEHRYRELVENIADIIYVTDEQGRFTFLNGAAEQFIGYPRETILGRSFADFLAPESYEVAARIFRRQRAGEDVGIFELDLYDGSGAKKTVETREKLVRDGDRIVAFQGIGRDITQRKRAEDALRALSVRHMAILRAVTDIIMEVDANKVYSWANQAGFEFFGENVIGKEASLYFEGEQDTYQKMQPLFDGGEDVFYIESWQRRADGQRRLLAWWCRALKDENGKVTGALSSARDITEHNAAEEALRESEKRYHSLFSYMLEGYAYCKMIFDDRNHPVDFIYLDVNESFERLTGLENVAGKRVTEVIPGVRESSPELFEIYGRVAMTGKSERVELHFKPLDQWLSISVYSIERGYFVSVFDNITERKVAEEALRESEERYRNLLDLAPVGIAVQSEGKIVFSNPAGAQIIGAQSPEEVTGRELSKIIHPDWLQDALDRIRRMMSGEKGLYPSENVYLRLDGTPVPVDVIATALTYQGKPAVQVIVTDISKRKQAEQAIKESEQRYRELVENIDDIMYVTDGTGKIIYLNKALERISGYTRQELLQKNYMELLTPESLRKVIELFKRQKKGQEVGLFEISIVDKDGKIKVVEAREQMIWDGDRIVQMRGLGRDITERKRAEERIYHLSRVLESIRNIDQLIVRVEDQDTLLSGACEILCEVSGYYFVWIGLVREEDKRVVPAAHWGYEDDYLENITVTWDDSPTGAGPIGTAIRTRRPSVFNDIAGDPDFLPWRDPALKRGYRSCMGIPIMTGKRVYGALGVYSDLAGIFGDEEASLLEEMAEDIAFALTAIEAEAERLHSVTALAESEERYRSLIDNIPIGIYRNTPGKKGIFIFSNRALLNMLGVPSFEALEGLSPADFYQEPSDRKAFSDELLKAGSVSGVELRLKRLDGTLLWGSVTARVLYNEKGKPAYFDCTLEDISERKRAEGAIRDSEEKFRDFFETSRDIVFITANDGTVLDVNTAFKEILGYSREEALSRNVTFFYNDPQLRDGFSKAIQANGFVRDYEVSLRRKNGTFADCLITAAARRDEDGAIIGYQGTIRDITEKKRMERRLIQAEKLSSLGGILSGVAHELNNPLTSIVGISQLIMRKSTSEDIRDKLEIIHRESMRTSKIIQGLLTFAREHKPERKMISINKIIEESYRLREYEFKVDNIAIKLELSEDIPLTAADPYQLQQVFINLINNSHDALVGGGGSALVIRSLSGDDSIIVEFEDDGPGIPEENLGFIFDPFFTTKEVGKGTGLGLSIVYGIINEHGGRIDASNGATKGAKFTIHLPLIREIGERPSPSEAPARKPHTEKAVLVVEDEESLRDLIAEILDQDGYRVDRCGDGQQAINKMKLMRYDAVITDLKMPGIGGIELYTFIQKHYPKLAPRVLFITGDVLNKDTQSFLKITGNIYIEKPFEIEVLLARVGELLER